MGFNICVPKVENIKTYLKELTKFFQIGLLIVGYSDRGCWASSLVYVVLDDRVLCTLEADEAFTHGCAQTL